MESETVAYLSPSPGKICRNIYFFRLLFKPLCILFEVFNLQEILTERLKMLLSVGAHHSRAKFRKVVSNSSVLKAGQ